MLLNIVSFLTFSFNQQGKTTCKLLRYPVTLSILWKLPLSNIVELDTHILALAGLRDFIDKIRNNNFSNIHLVKSLAIIILIYKATKIQNPFTT